jgi:hypothetical protein
MSQIAEGTVHCVHIGFAPKWNMLVVYMYTNWALCQTERPSTSKYSHICISPFETFALSLTL